MLKQYIFQKRKNLYRINEIAIKELQAIPHYRKPLGFKNYQEDKNGYFM